MLQSTALLLLFLAISVSCSPMPPYNIDDKPEYLSDEVRKPLEECPKPPPYSSSKHNPPEYTSLSIPANSTSSIRESSPPMYSITPMSSLKSAPPGYSGKPTSSVSSSPRPNPVSSHGMSSGPQPTPSTTLSRPGINTSVSSSTSMVSQSSTTASLTTATTSTESIKTSIPPSYTIPVSLGPGSVKSTSTSTHSMHGTSFGGAGGDFTTFTPTNTFDVAPTMFPGISWPWNL